MGPVRWSWPREPSPVVGITIGTVLVLVATFAMIPARDSMSSATPALVLVLPVVASGLTGGRVAAVTVALGAALAYNLAFIPPYGSPNIDVVEDVTAVLVLVAVGLAVGTLVARESERRRVAEQRAAALSVLNEQYEIVHAEREELLEETTRLAVLEQVDAQRAALLRSVSHDLRTPLAAIKAVASDLRAQVDYDDATREDLLDLVIEETERLDRIVGNLLSMSRIEAGALQPERQAVALDELCASCVRRLAPVFKRSRVRVESSFPDDLPLVNADYSQLDQVVTNLLENAARYAPAASVVRITGKTAGRDRVQLTIEDEGPGVPRHERGRAFAPFERGPGSTGTGVGLAICRAIVEAHGGSIAVEDGLAGGARFVVTLPVRRA
jgi:two-component system sensor histidine kinase KdpD